MWPFRRRKLRDIMRIWFPSARSFYHASDASKGQAAAHGGGWVVDATFDGSGNLGISEGPAFQSFLEINVQLGADPVPVMTMAGPFLRDILCCQIQELQEAVVCGKYCTTLGNFPKLSIESFNGVGSVMPISA